MKRVFKMAVESNVLVLLVDDETTAPVSSAGIVEEGYRIERLISEFEELEQLINERALREIIDKHKEEVGSLIPALQTQP